MSFLNSVIKPEKNADLTADGFQHGDVIHELFLLLLMLNGRDLLSDAKAHCLQVTSWYCIIIIIIIYVYNSAVR